MALHLPVGSLKTRSRLEPVQGTAAEVQIYLEGKQCVLLIITICGLVVQV